MLGRRRPAASIKLRFQVVKVIELFYGAGNGRPAVLDLAVQALVVGAYPLDLLFGGPEHVVGVGILLRHTGKTKTGPSSFQLGH